MKQKQMKFSALALAVLGLWLLALVWDGKIAEYINPQLVVLIFPAGLLCIILAQVVLSAAGAGRTNAGESTIGQEDGIEGDTGWAGWQILWLGLPLVIGIIFP